jgi:hypothetical protein
MILPLTFLKPQPRSDDRACTARLADLFQENVVPGKGEAVDDRLAGIGLTDCGFEYPR